MTLRNSGIVCPRKALKLIEKLRAVLSSSTSEESLIFTTVQYQIGSFFLISHSSGDIPLLVGYLQIPPTNYYTLIEKVLEKCMKRLREM